MAGRVTLAGARVSAGYTQEKMAELMGVSRQTINSWETGKYEIGTPQLIAFCSITGFSINDISLPDKSTKSGE